MGGKSGVFSTIRFGDFRRCGTGLASCGARCPILSSISRASEMRQGRFHFREVLDRHAAPQSERFEVAVLVAIMRDASPRSERHREVRDRRRLKTLAGTAEGDGKIKRVSRCPGLRP